MRWNNMDEVNCNTAKIYFFSDDFIAVAIEVASSYNMYIYLAAMTGTAIKTSNIYYIVNRFNFNQLVKQ